MRSTIATLAALCLSTTAFGQYPELHYDPIDLGTLGGSASQGHEAHGITTALDRAVVGQAQTPSGDWHPFLWTDGQMQDLGTFGGPLGSAASMNLFGVVVGHADAPGPAAANPRAFRWDPVNGLKDLGDLGGGRSWATGIDLYGESICGHSVLANGDTHGFFRSAQGGPLVDIGTLGGSTSFADGVDASIVVGGATTATGSMRAIYWHPALGLVDLGTLGGTTSRATATANGSVCGWSRTASGETHAFLVTSPLQSMTDLGTLGGTISVALGMTNSGRIVGTSETEDGSLHAFYWDKLSQQMLDLNDRIPEHSDWVLEAANYTDDFGFICGHGIHQGVRRAFMLRPFKVQVLGFAGTTNTLNVDFCEPGEPIFYAWSLRGNTVSPPGFFGSRTGFGGLSYAGRAIAKSWGQATLYLDVPASVSGTTVYFKAIAPNRRLASPEVAKTYF
jgi:probable HAF family extracellular repeat protein